CACPRSSPAVPSPCCDGCGGLHFRPLGGARDRDWRRPHPGSRNAVASPDRAAVRRPRGTDIFILWRSPDAPTPAVAAGPMGVLATRSTGLLPLFSPPRERGSSRSLRSKIALQPGPPLALRPFGCARAFPPITV